MQLDWTRIDGALADYSRWTKLLEEGQITLKTVNSLLQTVTVALPSGTLENSVLRTACAVMEKIERLDKLRQKEVQV